jgi:ribosomal protein S1
VILLPEPGRNLELSVRQAKPDPWDTLARHYQVRDTVSGTVKWLSAKSAFVEVIPGVDGLIPLRELAPWPVDQPDQLLWIGDEVEAIITQLDPPADDAFGPGTRDHGAFAGEQRAVRVTASGGRGGDGGVGGSAG